jgi:hypothetical protein
MGGDSAMTSDGGVQSLRSPKVFERNGLLFGVTGEMRVAQNIAVRAAERHQSGVAGPFTVLTLR